MPFESLHTHDFFSYPEPSPANIGAHIALMSWGCAKPRALLMTRAARAELAEKSGCNVWMDEKLPDTFLGVPIIEVPGVHGDKLWWLVLPPAEVDLRPKWLRPDGCEP